MTDVFADTTDMTFGALAGALVQAACEIDVAQRSSGGLRGRFPFCSDVGADPVAGRTVTGLTPNSVVMQII